MDVVQVNYLAVLIAAVAYITYQPTPNFEIKNKKLIERLRRERIRSLMSDVETKLTESKEYLHGKYGSRLE